jgi:hypothetical protein
MGRALTVIHTSHAFQYNFALMQQLSASVTSAALMTGSIFPNVTLPHFEVAGGYVDGMGGIMAAAFAPLIKHEERSEWEEYAVLNQGWLTESARLKKVHPGHRDALHGTIQDHEHDRRLQTENPPLPSIHTQIYEWENGIQVPEASRPGQVLAPLWQLSPASAPAVNGTHCLFCLHATMNLLRVPRFSLASFLTFCSQPPLRQESLRSIRHHDRHESVRSVGGY